MMGEHSNVYVRGLPEGITEATFRQLFEGYGNIISLKLFPEKRFGFVKYGSFEEAQAMIDSMNGFEYNGTQLAVRFANNDRGGAWDNGGAWSPGGGGACAAAAMAGGWQQGKGAANGGPGAYAAAAAAEAEANDNLYIKGLPPNMSDTVLREVFGAYGGVISTRVLETQGRSPDGLGESVALVRMESVEQATWLVDNLNGNIPQGLDKPITVRYAAAPGNRQKTQNAGALAAFGGPAPTSNRWSPYPQDFGGGGGGGGGFNASQMGGSGDQNSNLYVKDMPPTGSDLYLYKVFAPFGAIQSVRAMVGQDGACSGIGFVKFTHGADAAKAISAVSGIALPDGSVLNVSVKKDKRKEDDRPF